MEGYQKPTWQHVMIQENEKKIISKDAKKHSGLAKDEDNISKNSREFWYWIGYWDGQRSIEEVTQ